MHFQAVSSQFKHGENLAHFHPHLHCLVSDGCISRDGLFYPISLLDAEKIMRLFRDKLFQRLLAKDIITTHVADVRSGNHMMGDVFETADQPSLTVKLIGSQPFIKVYIIKDGRYVYSTEPGKAEVQFSWRDNAPQAGKRSYYYVRGEQQDGQIVWVSPMWITYKGR
jgi:hypothetical protein